MQDEYSADNPQQSNQQGDRRPPPPSGGSGVLKWILIGCGGLVLLMVILPVIAAIVVPSLLTSRKAANETKAIGALKAINTAQATYRRKNPVYASTLQMLVDDGGLDSGIQSSQTDYSGYTIYLLYPTAVTGAGSDESKYSIGVTPAMPGDSGDMSYYSNSKSTVWHLGTKVTALTATDSKWPVKGDDGVAPWEVAGQ